MADAQTYSPDEIAYANQQLGADPAQKGAASDDSSAVPSGPYSDSEVQAANKQLGPDPTIHTGADVDHIVGQSAVGRVLHAFGEGAADGWGVGNLGLSEESEAALQKAGILPDYKNAQGGMFKAINEALIRPAAVALDLAQRTLGAGFGAYQSGVAQIGEETGAPQLGRDLAALPEAFQGDPELATMRAPHLPTLADAQAHGVIGAGEEGWKGLAEPQEPHFEAVKDTVKAEQEAAPQSASGQVAATMDAPPPPPDAVPEQPAQPPTIDSVARQIAPDTFKEYDELSARKAELGQQIQASTAQLHADAIAQAPNAAEIADLQERLQDTTPRLAKKYQARLDDMLPAYNDFINDEDKMALLTRDTPEIQAMRQQQQAIDYRMRDLAPDVTAATREAAKQFPAPEPATPETAPQAPDEIAVANAAEPETPQTEAQIVPAEAVAQDQPDLLTHAPSQPAKPPIDIASDASSNLVAAGRPKEEADAVGQLLNAYYETRAQRFNGARGTAQDLYEAEAPTVKSGRERVPEYAQRKGRELNQTAKGKIKLVKNARSVITLMKDADASTFLHETGHQWLEDLMGDAAHPAATDALRSDAQAVKNWLGVKDGDEISTRQHERWARGFEQYLMEGRAPSARLAGVFDQFRQWLTKIYGTMSRIGRPINDDIRDVMDRLISAEPTERPVIAPEPEERTFVTETKPDPVYQKVPKEPLRFGTFLKKNGGVKDDGGDIKAMLGGKNNRPGLINKKGIQLDEATKLAIEHGYLPEGSDVSDLLSALEDDLKGNPRYSENDRENVEAYHGAISQNAEIDRLADEHGVDPKGLTLDQFYDKVAEKISADKAKEEESSLLDSLAAERGDISDEFVEHGTPRTLEDIDEQYRAEANAHNVEPVSRSDERSGQALGREDEGQAGEGSGGNGAGAGRRDEAQGSQGNSGSNAQGREFPGRGASGTETGGYYESAGPNYGSDAGPIEKAANIRLDKMNTTVDMEDALRDIAKANGDFMDARYGNAAFEQQRQIKNTRQLLGMATAEFKTAREAVLNNLTPESALAFEQASQRAAMVFRKLATMSSDWAHAGHELNRVVEGFGDMKDLGAQASRIEGLTGKTLFQIQEQARLSTKFDTPEQAGKFASDLEKTSWQKWRGYILAYYINNLISGPLTHGAYAIGNFNLALYKATVETSVQAAFGAARQALSAERIDRVHIGEVPAQLFGMYRGFRDGLVPGWEAFKTGVPVLPGQLQGQLDLAGLNAREQVLPGKVGYVLETPSRSVSAIHTVFYSMAYAQETARLAYREAANAGLKGNEFERRVAELQQSPTAEMMQAAHDGATEQVLMKRPAYGGFNQKAQALVNSNILLKIAIPFMQIGTNILEQGIVQRSALSMLLPEARAEVLGLRGGAARDLRMGKIAAGSMLSLGVIGMAAEGLISGAAPTDPGKRRVWQANGNKEYSLKVGNTWIPYRKYLGPLGPLVGLHADMYQTAHSLSDAGFSKAATAGLMGMAEVVSDETWMTGLSNFVKAAMNWDGPEGQRYLSNLATSFLPFSIGMGQTARLVDHYQRQAHGFPQMAENKLPFLSQNLEPQIDIWGRPIASHTMLSPATAENDPVDNRLQALDMGITMPERRLRGVSLTDRQYTDLATLSGRMTKTALNNIVMQPGFSAMTDADQKRIITETISKTRKKADTIMLARDIVLNKGNSIIMQATQAKMAKRGISLASH